MCSKLDSQDLTVESNLPSLFRMPHHMTLKSCYGDSKKKKKCEPSVVVGHRESKANLGHNEAMRLCLLNKRARKSMRNMLLTLAELTKALVDPLSDPVYT